MRIIRSNPPLRSVPLLAAALLLAVPLAAQVQVDTFSPPEISTYGGTPIVVTGSGFDLGSPVFVRVGTQIATIQSVTPTEIQAIAAADATIGPLLDVLVTVSGVGSDTLFDATTVVGPLAVDFVDPDTVPEGSGDAVTVHGLAFTPGASVQIGGVPVPPSDVTYLETRRLLVDPLPALGAGTYDVTVSVPSSLGPVVETLTDGLTVTPQLTLDTFDPTQTSYLGGETFTLTGVGLTPSTEVTINGNPVPVTLVAPTTLEGVLPPDPVLPFGTVVATDPLTGNDTLVNAFEYIGQFQLNTIDPQVVDEGAPNLIDLSGAGFTPATRVEVAGELLAVDFIAQDQAQAAVPGLPGGLYDVRAFDVEPDGTEVESILPTALLVVAPDPPVVSEVLPPEVCADGGTFVTVRGEGFLPESQVIVHGLPLVGAIVNRSGTEVTGFAPELPMGIPAGPADVVASDLRGMTTLPGGMTYTEECPTLAPPEQFESSLAEGTALFSWYNPEPYDSIEVHDADGNLVATLPGDTTSYETPSGIDPAVMLSFRGVAGSALSVDRSVLAQIFPCNYPPPLGGAVLPGERDLAIYGGHAPANVDRCSGIGGDLTPAPEGLVRFAQPAGSTGFVFPQNMLQQIGTPGTPRPTTLITGFTLENDADLLEFSAVYQKTATVFGLSLRAKLVQVFPPDGYVDEFTFPDPKLGAPRAKQSVTYYRGDGDVADPSTEPCLSNGLLPIPAGEYRLEIYAVGGNPDTAYYVFADDPRDQESLIEGVPCPPYPLVEVRNVTGQRTLPNAEIFIDAAFPSIEKIQVELSARGSYIDENGIAHSIDPYCDQVFAAPSTGGGPSIVICTDPPYEEHTPFEYCWTIEATEPAHAVTGGPLHTDFVPEYNCYEVCLTIRDLACGTSRTYFAEIVVSPPDRNVCPPGTMYNAFLRPTPDPSTIHAIANLANLDPALGTFSSVRPLELQLFVAPLCWCQYAPLDECPSILILDDPGADPVDLSGPEDDVQFRLAVRLLSSLDPPVFTYFDLGAEIRVLDLCPNVVEGPKYLQLRIDDLGEIPWSSLLDDYDFTQVFLQGRTNYTYELNGGMTDRIPVSDDWSNISHLRMTNHPEVLESTYWNGYFDEADASYHFNARGTEDPTVVRDIPDSETINFGIVDAGIPAYSGQEIRSGFTSRFGTSGGSWFAETGDSKAGGSLFENDLRGAPHTLEPQTIQNTTFGPGVPAYEWCDAKSIVKHSFSQTLFEAIIYAGTIGPIPVNIWGQVGLGLSISVDSIIQNRVAPFDPFVSSGDFFELDYVVESEVEIRIPCGIRTDILGGIASIALRLVPTVNFLLHPYLEVDVPSNPSPVPMVFAENTFSLDMEAEACVQTLILGEQCLPTITIPLIPPMEIIDIPSDGPPPATSCGPPLTATQTLPPSSPGGILIESYEIANKPVTVVSPDEQIVVDAWVSADTIGRFLKVDITEGGTIDSVETGVPGIAWYFLDPDAAFIANDKVMFVGTAPPDGFVPEPVPADVNDPQFVPARNRNAGHTEVRVALLAENQFQQWELDLPNAMSISDPDPTLPADRFADGNPAIAGDPVAGLGYVSWVRYSDGFLVEDGVIQHYRSDPTCPVDELCLFTVPNIRPRMESTTIAVRVVDENGPIGPAVTISDPGINVQPDIAVSPSGDFVYCVWIHDPTHTDLIAANRGRTLRVSVLDTALGTWSLPFDAVSVPDSYPAMLEPHILLTGDDEGILTFTAVGDDAPLRDTGLTGGSRRLFVSRLIAGVFQAPVEIRGVCEALEYGYSQQTAINLPTWIDPASQLGYGLPEVVLTWQEFGRVGLDQGSGNVRASFLDTANGQWSDPISLVPQGTVVTNVSTSLVNGAIRSIHFDAGLSDPGAVGPLVGALGYTVMEHAMQPDAVLADCKVSFGFGSPGAPVDVSVRVENHGLATTAFDGASQSATGVELVFLREDGTETIVGTAPLPVLGIEEAAVVDFTVETPHRPVQLIARVSPNPGDRDPSNDSRTCFLGAPPPENLACEVIERTDDLGVVTHAVELTWDNPVLYDEVRVYRDGSMLFTFPGHVDRVVDAPVLVGSHIWEVRGVIAASLSTRTSTECEVLAPIRFIRGDANADGTLNVADPITALGYLFSEDTVPCLVALDANDDGATNIADAIWVLATLFSQGAPPRPPFPDCGPDPTPDALGCDSFDACP